MPKYMLSQSLSCKIIFMLLRNYTFPVLDTVKHFKKFNMLFVSIAGASSYILIWVKTGPQMIFTSQL